MPQNQLDNEQNFNKFKNFYEWLKLESGQLRELTQTPQGKKAYQEIYQAECATMLEMMLPAYRRIIVVLQNKTGIAMCSCMDARRYSDMGEPVIFVCKDHQTRFGTSHLYWEDELSFFLEHYSQNDRDPVLPEPTLPKREWSDRDFLKDLNISSD
ncbi:MAG: hypothetical protein A2655_03390 [Candidatus Yanofskybacteria bacterium RIFCSPHIGHO2_01_FULL_43_42]|nr:MAG: hypothetical protein A2655_03390 [Candidatus Yanofskybacteria bacterium RIFCSPHIGHO2_01_FULL_43_42]OGN13039.1 MAG: hypothetical protein A3D48_04050 [Candidatus Yanofskybacteria bacterium RIFCSPHIGHO2_02_FULL_43_17]